MLALLGWVSLTQNESPLREGTSVVEAVFDPDLWAALALYVVSYVVMSAAIGMVGGLLAARLFLFGRELPARSRRLWLVRAPIVGALVSLAVGLGVA